MKFNEFQFLGNLFSCPFGSRLPDCKVYLLDYSTFREKFKWFESLSEEEKNSVVKHHNQCWAKRFYNKSHEEV